jgi:integrase
VAQATVDATLPFLTPQVAAMVRLQLLTGMRPGEVAVMRGMDLETGGKVWLYRPGSDQGRHGAHKNAYRGHHRQILIGPRAQEVLRPWLRLNIAEYLFQPREAMNCLNAQRRLNRKTPMTPSQAKRARRKSPRKGPGDRYTASSYASAVANGCDKAFPHPDLAALRVKDLPARQRHAEIAAWVEGHSEELAAWRHVHRWHPNQLRHAKATEIRREAGLDAARAVLGHRSPVITETYAEQDMATAAAVMERLG